MGIFCRYIIKCKSSQTGSALSVRYIAYIIPGIKFTCDLG